MEQVNICTIFNALPRVTIKFLKKKYTITFFIKLTVTRGNPLKMVQICTYSLQSA